MALFDGAVDPGRYLYHYTTRAAALGSILPQAQLRLGPLTWTNDPRESQYGLVELGTDAGDDVLELLKAAGRAINGPAKVACFTRDDADAMAEQPDYLPLDAATLSSDAIRERGLRAVVDEHVSRPGMRCSSSRTRTGRPSGSTARFCAGPTPGRRSARSPARSPASSSARRFRCPTSPSSRSMPTRSEGPSWWAVASGATAVRRSCRARTDACPPRNGPTTTSTIGGRYGRYARTRRRVISGPRALGEAARAAAARREPPLLVEARARGVTTRTAAFGRGHRWRGDVAAPTVSRSACCAGQSCGPSGMLTPAG